MRQGLITSGLNHTLHNLIDESDKSFTFKAGEKVPFNVTEKSLVDAIGFSYSNLIIDSRPDAPQGLNQQAIETGYSLSGGGGVSGKLGVFTQVAGQIILDVTRSGRNLLDFFKTTNLIKITKIGSAAHLAWITGYNLTSDGTRNQLWHSFATGTGLSMEAGQSVYDVHFKPKQYVY